AGEGPVDWRPTKGAAAARDLVSTGVPMFAFAIRSMLEEYDVDHAEGRVEALRRAVPVVAGIRDSTRRDEYARQLAGWVGWDDPAAVLRRVREEARRAAGRARSAGARRRGPGGPGGGPRPGRDRAERGGRGYDDEAAQANGQQQPEGSTGIPLPSQAD